MTDDNHEAFHAMRRAMLDALPDEIGEADLINLISALACEYAGDMMDAVYILRNAIGVALAQNFEPETRH